MTMRAFFLLLPSTSALLLFLPAILPSPARAIQCVDDASLECPDGLGGYVVVHRDPSNHCALPTDCPCPPEQKRCDDGSVRYRDPELECAFDACPEEVGGTTEAEVTCDVDVERCYDGSGAPSGYVRRDPASGCGFYTCSSEHVVDETEACPIWLCVDPTTLKTGRAVAGDPLDGCRPDCAARPPPFESEELPPPELVSEPVPEPELVSEPVPEPQPEPELVSEPLFESEALPPPEPQPQPELDVVQCDGGVRHCPNGATVGRDPKQGCAFTSCEEAEDMVRKCKGRKTVQCADGTRRFANPEDGCRIPSCNDVVDDGAQEGEGPERSPTQPTTQQQEGEEEGDRTNEAEREPLPDPHVPCSTLDARRDDRKLHSICDKFCVKDDCVSVLSSARGTRRGLRRNGGARGRSLKDTSETCEKLEEMFLMASGQDLDCSRF